MNSTDLHTLLATPPLSRATFFAQLLAEPSPQTQTETLADDQAPDTTSEPAAATAAPAQAAPTGFPA